MKIFALAVMTGVTLLGATAKAPASVEYPWCVMTGGRDGGVMNCGFVSYAQCMQTRIGTDMCVVNPHYKGPRTRAERR